MPSSSSRASWRGSAAPRCWSDWARSRALARPRSSDVQRAAGRCRRQSGCCKPKRRGCGLSARRAYGNTHYWLDPHNARPITASILTALQTLRPAEKASSKQPRCVPCAPRCQNLGMGNRAEALPRHQGRRRARQLGLFRRAVRIAIVAAAEPHPGIPPSPAELAALFKRMRKPACASLLPIRTQIRLGAADCEKGGATSVTLFPPDRTTSPVRGKREAARGNSEVRLKD